MAQKIVWDSRNLSFISQKAESNSIFIKNIILSTLGFLVFGCNFVSGNNESITPISSIKNQDKANYTVYIKGQVTNQAGFVNGGAYQLKDGTDSIWIVSNQTLPAIGDEVMIQGKVQFKTMPLIFAAGGKKNTEAYIKEEKQLERKTPNN